MPERCARSCSTVTASSISGRSGPSTDRAVVARASTPSWMRLTTVSAVRPFVALATPNRLSLEFAMPCARSAIP
jgi:hypothetical protein